MATPQQQANKELARRELARREAAKPSQLEAAGRGLVQGASFGFADELSAGAGASISSLSDTVSNFVNGDLEFGNFIGEYRDRVEKARAADAAASEAFPKTFLAGQAGGAIASGALTGGAGLAGKGFAGAVKLGAGLGGLAAAGSSEADLTKGDVGGLAQDVILGSAIGGATGVGGEAISRGLGAAGGAIGRTRLGGKLKDIASNIIRPKAVAADLRNAAKASTKKAFDPRLNKNLERGVEGLQKRGVITTDRKAFQNMDKRDLFEVVGQEADTLGKSISNVTKLADEAGVDFGSDTVGLQILRKTAKDIRKGSTSDEFITSIDNVTDLLKNRHLKATDLQGIKQELDGLIKTGQNLKSIKKAQMKTLMGVRTKIKVALEDKIDDAATRSPQLRAELESHDVKNFAELNDAFGDTAVVKNTLGDAAALANFEEGAFQASPLSEQLSGVFEQEGVLGAITKGAAKIAGGTAEAGVKGAAAVTRTVGPVARKAAQLQRDSALVARQLYQSIDEDNIVSDEQERKAHAGRVMNNSALSHAQKFNEVNKLTTTGEIDPNLIPKRDVQQILKEIDKQNKELRAEVLREL